MNRTGQLLIFLSGNKSAGRSSWLQKTRADEPVITHIHVITSEFDKAFEGHFFVITTCRNITITGLQRSDVIHELLQLALERPCIANVRKCQHGISDDVASENGSTKHCTEGPECSGNL